MNTMKLLANGAIAQGIVELTASGEIANPVPIFQPELIGSAKDYYPDKTRSFSFGKRTLIGNTVTDLWEGPTARYAPPPSPMQMSVASNAGVTALGAVSGWFGAL